MKELNVKCNLYFDMLSDNESRENAINRLLELLNENDIAINIHFAEVEDIEY